VPREGFEPPVWYSCLQGKCNRPLCDLGGTGRKWGIRTHDPLLPKQMLYQAELISDKIGCRGGTRTPVIWLMRPSWNHLQSTLRQKLIYTTKLSICLKTERSFLYLFHSAILIFSTASADISVISSYRSLDIP
jgi:hypothetical protein